jgi:hypothetical protein
MALVCGGSHAGRTESPRAVAAALDRTIQHLPGSSGQTQHSAVPAQNFESQIDVVT